MRRRFAFQVFLHGVVKEVVGHGALVDIRPELYNHFGFSTFHARQEEAIRSLVISPLIALIRDHVDSLSYRNIPAAIHDQMLRPESAAL